MFNHRGCSTKNYGNDKQKILPPFFYYCYNTKTISRILLKFIACSCFISHFFLFFFLIPTVSYWACPTWYVSSVTPLSPIIFLNSSKNWHRKKSVPHSPGLPWYDLLNNFLLIYSTQALLCLTKQDTKRIYSLKVWI